MAKKQLFTVSDNLEMAEVNKGTVRVLSVSLYRHAGDHDAGIEDSWFTNVLAELKGHEGSRIEERFTFRSMCGHGKPKEFCGNVAKNVLMAGELNLKHWKSDTPQ